MVVRAVKPRLKSLLCLLGLCDFSPVRDHNPLLKRKPPSFLEHLLCARYYTTDFTSRTHVIITEIPFRGHFHLFDLFILPFCTGSEAEQACEPPRGHCVPRRLVYISTGRHPASQQSTGPKTLGLAKKVCLVLFSSIPLLIWTFWLCLAIGF